MLFFISPRYSRERILSIIDGYQNVIDDNLLFSEFLSANTDNETMIDLGNEFLAADKFAEIFENRKTPASVEIYRAFYEMCWDFKDNPTQRNLKELKDISSKLAIKRAFGFGKTPFEFNKNFDVYEF